MIWNTNLWNSPSRDWEVFFLFEILLNCSFKLKLDPSSTGSEAETPTVVLHPHTVHGVGAHTEEIHIPIVWWACGGLDSSAAWFILREWEVLFLNLSISEWNSSFRIPHLPKKPRRPRRDCRERKKKRREKGGGKKKIRRYARRCLFPWQRGGMCSCVWWPHAYISSSPPSSSSSSGCWQCVFLHAAPAAVTCQGNRRTFVMETWETLRGLESNLRETSDTLPVFKHGSRAWSRDSTEFTPPTCSYSRNLLCFSCVFMFCWRRSFTLISPIKMEQEVAVWLILIYFIFINNFSFTCKTENGHSNYKHCA